MGYQLGKISLGNGNRSPRIFQLDDETPPLLPILARFLTCLILVK